METFLDVVSHFLDEEMAEMLCVCVCVCVEQWTLKMYVGYKQHDWNVSF